MTKFSKVIVHSDGDPSVGIDPLVAEVDLSVSVLSADMQAWVLEELVSFYKALWDMENVSAYFAEEE